MVNNNNSHNWRAGTYSKRIVLFLLQCGSEDVKRHRWFKHIDWADVFMKKLQVHYKKL